MDLSALSYQKFVDFALRETNLRTVLAPLSSHEKFRLLTSKDNNSTLLRTLSYRAPKIRHLRSLTVDENPTMKVLDFAVFPEPEFDLPIFCSNFFATPSVSIIVLDLNPLYDVIIHSEYREKYYRKLLPVGQKYFELLPWGGNITSESLRFFSPIVIWSRFSSSQSNHDVLYSAFMDYFKAWLELVDQAEKETSATQICGNRQAQHKYLTWRAEKDPGYPILKKLVGEHLAKEVVRDFLFSGVDTLGSKTFLDYFPEYKCDDGKVNKKRSMMGKSYEIRPWNLDGEFIGSELG